MAAFDCKCDAWTGSSLRYYIISRIKAESIKLNILTLLSLYQEKQVVLSRYDVKPKYLN